METIASGTVWEGGDPGSAYWSPYYVKLSEGGGPKTHAELGPNQAKRFAKLIKQFEAWKRKFA